MPPRGAVCQWLPDRRGVRYTPRTPCKLRGGVLGPYCILCFGVQGIPGTRGVLWGAGYLQCLRRAGGAGYPQYPRYVLGCRVSRVCWGVQITPGIPVVLCGAGYPRCSGCALECRVPLIPEVCLGVQGAPGTSSVLRGAGYPGSPGGPQSRSGSTSRTRPKAKGRAPPLSLPLLLLPRSSSSSRSRRAGMGRGGRR